MGERRKKAHGGEHENAERWLLTYADMITLLMAFFILLYTMAKVDTAKLRAVSSAVRDKFGYTYVTMIPTVEPDVSSGMPLNPTDKSPPKIVNRPLTIPASFRLAVKNIVKILKREGTMEHVKLGFTRRGMVLSIAAGGLLFDTGSAVLTPQSKKVLMSVGTILSGLENRIEIQGHADEQQSDREMLGNWLLSINRSLSVLEYLVRNKFVAEQRMVISGYAHYQPPPVPAKDEAERLRFSRRVDIIALYDEKLDSPSEADLKGLGKLPDRDWTMESAPE